MGVEEKPKDEKMSETKDKVDKKAEEPELSEEDQKLKEELDLLATRAQDSDVGVQAAALTALSAQIRDSIGNMSTIPKPLKFLQDHFEALKTSYETCTTANKSTMADILSVLAMTMSEPGSGESLKYRLEGGDSIAEWGHEYIRSLCGELGTAWTALAEESKSTDHLLPLVKNILTYNMSHSAESEAVDLLLEVERLEDLLLPYITDQNWHRVCQYLLSCAHYLPPDDATAVRKVCVQVMRSQEQVTDALRVAMMLNDKPLAQEIFDGTTDELVKKQMALMLGSQLMFLESEDDELVTLMNNEHLSKHFLGLGRELNVLEPKLPADVFKTTGESRAVDSARMNLASTLVNGFVNAGFCNDKLMHVGTEGSESSKTEWVYKNKDHGMISAVASVGMIMMWNTEDGLSALDRYMYTTTDQITAGALLGCGIVSANVRNEFDAALALLSTRVEDKSDTIRACSLLGLGIGYAGTAREDIMELIMPAVLDADAVMEVVAVGALALGLVYTGSCNSDVAESLIQCLLERPVSDLKNPLARFIALGLGLVYLGKGEAADVILETCKALDSSISELCVVLVQICAYATSGDVLQVQSLLEIAGRHPSPASEKPEEPAPEAGAEGAAAAAGKDKKAGGESDKDADKPPELDPEVARVVELAVIGIGVVAMGEDVGAAMATRMTNHLIQFGDVAARRAVPLCLAMLSTSNAEYRVEVTESLQKLSHDPDPQTSMAAIFSLGLVGAGTNNSRIADSLRQLATYYEREPNHVFVVRLAQGFLHMGKGLLTLYPLHSDRSLVRPTALAALLTVAMCGMDFKNIILTKFQYLLYTVSLAMQPRMLVCLDKDLEPVSVSVRVGQAVDTVGQAGKPKRITAFQTHNTPVLIHSSERAEFATDEHTALTNVLEGFVVVKPKEEEEKKD